MGKNIRIYLTKSLLATISAASLFMSSTSFCYAEELEIPDSHIDVAEIIFDDPDAPGILDNEAEQVESDASILINEVSDEEALLDVEAENGNLEVLSTITATTPEEFYSDALFIGDSIMVAFKNYSSRYKSSVTHNAQFMAKNGLAAFYALKGNEKPEKQPEFNGARKAIWENIDSANIKKVFLSLGTNDLVGVSPERTSDNIITLVNNIKEVNPDIEIYIIGIAPVYAGTNKGYLSNQNIAIFNACLEEKATALEIPFVDIAKSLKTEGGDINPNYSSDSYVHQNRAAYDVWNQVLTEYAQNLIDQAQTISEDSSSPSQSDQCDLQAP